MPKITFCIEEIKLSEATEYYLDYFDFVKLIFLTNIYGIISFYLQSSSTHN
jgi:hypothetical protein